MNSEIQAAHQYIGERKGELKNLIRQQSRYLDTIRIIIDESGTDHQTMEEIVSSLVGSAMEIHKNAIKEIKCMEEADYKFRKLLDKHSPKKQEVTEH